MRLSGSSRFAGRRHCCERKGGRPPFQEFPPFCFWWTENVSGCLLGGFLLTGQLRELHQCLLRRLGNLRRRAGNSVPGETTRSAGFILCRTGREV